MLTLSLFVLEKVVACVELDWGGIPSKLLAIHVKLSLSGVRELEQLFNSFELLLLLHSLLGLLNRLTWSQLQLRRPGSASSISLFCIFCTESAWHQKILEVVLLLHFPQLVLKRLLC